MWLHKRRQCIAKRAAALAVNPLDRSERRAYSVTVSRRPSDAAASVPGLADAETRALLRYPSLERWRLETPELYQAFCQLFSTHG